MAIQSTRSETRTEMLEGAVLDALIVLLVATVAAVVANYVGPVSVSYTAPPATVTEIADYGTAMRYAYGQVSIVDEGAVQRSLIDFRASEKGFMSAEQQSLIDFRAGERR